MCALRYIGLKFGHDALSPVSLSEILEFLALREAFGDELRGVLSEVKVLLKVMVDQLRMGNAVADIAHGGLDMNQTRLTKAPALSCQ